MTKRSPYFRLDRGLSTADPYRADLSLPEPSICERCQAVWRKGKWSLDEELRKEVLRFKKPYKVVCPACRRAEEGYPAGVIYLRGSFLLAHKDQILNTIRNEEAAALVRNPLDRVIRIEDRGKEGIVIETASERLATKLGRAVEKACSGELKIRFSEQEKLVRVYWSRDEATLQKTGAKR